MGGAPNPAMAAMLPMIMARIAAARAGGGGPGPGMPGGASGPPMPGGPMGSPADAAQSAGFNRELSSARQADPAALAQRLTAMKQEISSLISQTGTSAPGVARHLGKLLGGFDGAIKEATTAAATVQIATPINASASQGAPSMGAPGGSPGGM